jgi:hypothetical protein
LFLIAVLKKAKREKIIEYLNEGDTTKNNENNLLPVQKKVR